MDLLDQLDTELDALRSVLGDEYEDVRGLNVRSSLTLRSASRCTQYRHSVVQAPGHHGRSEEVVAEGSSSDDDGNACFEGSAVHGTAQAGQDGQVDDGNKDTLLHHVDAALESNAALSSKLNSIIEHVRVNCIQ